MTRQGVATKLDQFLLSTGALALYGVDQNGPHFAPDVVEQLNWSYANRPQQYYAGPCGGAGWGDAASPRILDIHFDGGGGTWKEKVFGYVELDADNSIGVTMGAACNFRVGETGDVKLTLDNGSGGVYTATISFTDADNGTLKTVNINFDVSLEYDWTAKWEIKLTSGSHNDNSLLYIYLADQTPFTIPAPSNG